MADASGQPNGGGDQSIGEDVYAIAQRGVVSSLMYLPEQINDVMGFLSPEDFEDNQLRVVYEAMTDLARNNGSKDEVGVDLPSVIAYLTMRGELGKAGGPNAVQMLYEDGAYDAPMNTVATYARTVKEIASKHRVHKLMTDSMKETAIDNGVTAKTVIEELQRQLTEETMSLVNDDSTKNIADISDEYLKTLSDRMEIYKDSGGDPLKAKNGIPSGFDTIDKYVGGWMPGYMITIGARTGIGKSSLALQFAENAAAGGQTVLFYSLEMQNDEINDKIVAATANVPLSHLKSGNVTEEEYQQVKAAKPYLDRMNLIIDTTPQITVDYIRSSARKQAATKKGLNLIVIDYLQLITPSADKIKAKANRQEQVSDISRNIKLLSMQLGVPIIVLVQLNRETKDDEDPTPTISDIRESNSIAQDSSVIILLHRNVRNAKDGERTLFIIGKNRNGKANVRFECETLLHLSKFKEVPKEGSAFDEPDADENAPAAVDGNAAADAASAVTGPDDKRTDDGKPDAGDDDPWADAGSFIDDDTDENDFATDPDADDEEYDF